MKYPAHVVGGITFGIISQHYLVQHLPIMQNATLPTLMLSASFVAGSVLGSLMPDIDHRGSYLGRRLPLLSWLTNATVGHRGATHAPFIAVAFATVLAFLSARFLSGVYELYCLLFIAGCMIGAFSHIFLDALTKSGVPLLYPFSKKHYRIGNFKTGGIGETLLTLAMIIFVIWFVSKRMIVG